MTRNAIKRLQKCKNWAKIRKLPKITMKHLKQAEAEVMPSSNLVEVGVGWIRCKLDEVHPKCFLATQKVGQ